MTVLQAIVAIIVAIIGAIGGTLAFVKYLIERQDKLKANNTQKQIDDTLAVTRKEISQEIKEAVQQGIIDCGVIGDKAIRQAEDDFVKKLEIGLNERSEEGKARFETHAKSFERVNEQIEENNKQISELSSSVGILVDKMDSFASSIGVLAESSCNSNYDRLLMVTNKILKANVMTISDKTNLKQLYRSWKSLGGKDDEMETKYEECMKLTPILDEN